MKSLRTFAAMIVVFISLAAGPAYAQQASTDAEINRLREEIRRREVVAHSDAILPDDKEVNRANLEKARASLRAALQSRIASKRELRATLGDSMPAEEAQKLDRELEALETELRAQTQAAGAEPSPTTATITTPDAAANPSSSSPQTPGMGPAAAPSLTANPPGVSVPPATSVALRSSLTAPVNEKTDVLPLRSCQEVERLLQQSQDAASAFEKFFCGRVKVLQRDKTLNSTGALAGLDLRRDFFFFMIALLAREGRAQYVLAAEEERVDKQVGSDASSSGSTSLVSKGSVPSIFGFAVDTGALLKSTSGSTITFRGNLAGAAKAVAGKGFISGYDEDSPAARLLRKVSFSLSYDPSRGDEAGVFTGTRQQLSGYSVRFDIYNKRDPRDSRYKRDWNNFLANQSNALSAQIQASLTRMTRIIQGANSSTIEWNDPELQAWFAAAAAAVRDADAADVETVLRAQLNDIPKELSGDTSAELESFNTRFRPWLEGREAILEKVAKASIITFEYLNDRPLNEPTLSTFKLIAETGLQRWLDLTFNGSLTMFNRRPAADTDRVRDFQFGLQLDAQLGEMGMGFGKPTLSFAGRYERLMANMAASTGVTTPDTAGNIGVGQIKFTLPIKNSGIKIPFSFSFANRTELVKESEVRGNFGFTFDLDSLFAKFRPF